MNSTPTPITQNEEILEITEELPAVVVPPKKKGRGRPRKHKKEEKKVLKKRGRKKKSEKLVCNLNDLVKIELNSEQIVNKSIIVHLPIDIKAFEEENNKIFENDYLNYDSTIISEPQPFDLADDIMNVAHEEIESMNITDNTAKEYKLIDDDRTVVKKINNVMMEFQNFKEKKFFRTDICCWHCCHKFETMPCGIPLSYENDIFHVKGVYCSFNCALKSNYDSKISENVIQERESLLYLMYKQMNNVKDIEIPYAPERETLQMFGGTLTIEEFRKNTLTYVMVYPPMLSIIPQLEEIKILESDCESNLVLNSVSKSGKPKKNTLDQLFKRK